MSSFSTGKWALRALSQSLAKEFGPQGVHVSHAIIDGVINIPRTQEWLKEAGPEAKLSADGVCNTFLQIESANMGRLPTTTGIYTRNPGPTSRGSLT
jgi:NAD(P)-dependent dehydrogenase (short-subunit alcohol dehydrogenase family)